MATKKMLRAKDIENLENTTITAGILDVDVDVGDIAEATRPTFTCGSALCIRTLACPSLQCCYTGCCITAMA